MITEAAQLIHIVLDDGISEHVGVHGRSQDHWTGTSHDRGGQHVVSNPTRHLTDDVGTGRGNQYAVSLLGQCDVFDIVLEVPIEGVDETLVLRQGFEGDGVDKIGGIFRHDHVNVTAALF